eukprot:Ihof_evm11s19 gene=Ihof_evmTU11s19
MSRQTRRTVRSVHQSSDEDIRLTQTQNTQFSQRTSRRGRREEDEECTEGSHSQRIILTQASQLSQTVTSTQAQKAMGKLSLQEQTDKATEIARFVLCRDSKKVPISLKEINDAVMKGSNSKATKELINEANVILLDIFGMILMELPPSGRSLQGYSSIKGPSSRKYILVNQLPERDLCVIRERDQPLAGLLLVVLGYIFMQQTKCIAEPILWEHLKMLGVETGKSHPVFAPPPAKADDAINDLVRQGYLDRRKADHPE